VTTAKTVALTAGLAGALALGVWGLPRVMDHYRATNTPTADVSTPAAETPAPAPAPRAARRAPAEPTAEALPPAAAAMPASSPELHARLKPLLNRGAKMTIAAEGFNSGEQFATVAHLARNTEVPFMVLKHRVLDEGKSLVTAVRESKPDLDAAAEVRRAREAAREDLTSLVS
jgi:hypothetical protein